MFIMLICLGGFFLDYEEGHDSVLLLRVLVDHYNFEKCNGIQPEGIQMHQLLQWHIPQGPVYLWFLKRLRETSNRLNVIS